MKRAVHSSARKYLEEKRLSPKSRTAKECLRDAFGAIHKGSCYTIRASNLLAAWEDTVEEKRLERVQTQCLQEPDLLSPRLFQALSDITATVHTVPFASKDTAQVIGELSNQCLAMLQHLHERTCADRDKYQNVQDQLEDSLNMARKLVKQLGSEMKLAEGVLQNGSNNANHPEIGEHHLQNAFAILSQYKTELAADDTCEVTGCAPEDDTSAQNKVNMIGGADTTDDSGNATILQVEDVEEGCMYTPTINTRQGDLESMQSVTSNTIHDAVVDTGRWDDIAGDPCDIAKNGKMYDGCLCVPVLAQVAGDSSERTHPSMGNEGGPNCVKQIPLREGCELASQILPLVACEQVPCMAHRCQNLEMCTSRELAGHVPQKRAGDLLDLALSPRASNSELTDEHGDAAHSPYSQAASEAGITCESGHHEVVPSLCARLISAPFTEDEQKQSQLQIANRHGDMPNWQGNGRRQLATLVMDSPPAAMSDGLDDGVEASRKPEIRQRCQLSLVADRYVSSCATTCAQELRRATKCNEGELLCCSVRSRQQTRTCHQSPSTRLQKSSSSSCFVANSRPMEGFTGNMVATYPAGKSTFDLGKSERQHELEHPTDITMRVLCGVASRRSRGIVERNLPKQNCSNRPMQKSHSAMLPPRPKTSLALPSLLVEVLSPSIDAKPARVHSAKSYTSKSRGVASAHSRGWP